MNYYDYTDRKAFVLDADIVSALELDASTDALLERYTKEEFLHLDPGMRIPFFAEIRNYLGACEQENPSAKWLVRRVDMMDGAAPPWR